MSHSQTRGPTRGKDLAETPKARLSSPGLPRRELLTLPRMAVPCQGTGTSGSQGLLVSGSELVPLPRLIPHPLPSPLIRRGIWRSDETCIVGHNRHSGYVTIVLISLVHISFG